MSGHRLVEMANQIGAFFKTQGEAKRVSGITEHIEKFWDPRMKARIRTHVDAGGEGLDLNVLEAIKLLSK